MGLTGPVPEVDDDEGIQVATTECPVNQDQLNDLTGRVENMGLRTTTVTPWQCVTFYRYAKQFVERCLH